MRDSRLINLFRRPKLMLWISILGGCALILAFANIFGLQSQVGWLSTSPYYASRDISEGSEKQLPLKVYIVEEHHEVIPHWVDVVKAFGGKKANLVHIDAHSDMDYPEIVDGFPEGRLPQTPYEVSTLMQSNDEFIQSAIIAQVLDTVYIVYPPWTSDQNIAYNSSIGRTKYKGDYYFCMCREIEDEPCTLMGLEENPNNETVLPDGSCKTMWPYRYLELTSSSAGGILRFSKYWSLPKLQSEESSVITVERLQYRPDSKSITAPLILDIDEDFFGVHLVSRTLIEAGISLETIYELSQAVRNLLCPQKKSDEKDIDEWFQGALLLIQTHCLQAPGGCTSFVKHKVYNSLMRSSDSWTCGNGTTLHFNELWSMLSSRKMTGKALTALSRVGVCLTKAWSTHDYTPTMRICIGHNTPNESAVEEFVPTSLQFQELTRNLTQVILSLPHAPQVITVCRSSRDGYTPRWLQHQIETFIISLLKKVFKLTSKDILLSTQLAGGALGWYFRGQWTPPEAVRSRYFNSL